MPSADPNFRILGPAHLAILIAIPAISALLTWLARRCPQRIVTVRIALGGFLVATSLGWHGYCLLRGWIRFPDSLPVAICDVSLLLSAVALLTLRVWAYEFAYYNGFGALMAVITPDLWESFPSPSTVQFFVGHCGILIAVIFLTCTHILHPRKGSAWRTFVAVNILAAIVGVLDVATGTNYLYLAAKPRTASILDYLGPWPFYLIAAEALMLMLFSLMELPFRKTGCRRRQSPRVNNPFPDNTSSLLGIRIPIAKS